MDAGASSKPSASASQAREVRGDELSPGMSVRLKSLVSQVQLNGSLGTLVKFGTKRDRWQVNLGAERGIVLLKACNLSASKSMRISIIVLRSQVFVLG